MATLIRGAGDKTVCSEQNHGAIIQTLQNERTSTRILFENDTILKKVVNTSYIKFNWLSGYVNENSVRCLVSEEKHLRRRSLFPVY